MKIKPSIFLTADTHFGHQNIITAKWGKRTDTFNEDIVDAWNKVVDKNDTVLHLGDLSMVNKEETKKWTLRLKGKKYLILGNHDEGTVTWYRDCGFEVIPDAHECFSDKHGQTTHYLFTHEPITNLPEGWVNIHGHLHGNAHRGEAPNTTQYIDVGVDVVGYAPIRLFDIMSRTIPLTPVTMTA